MTTNPKERPTLFSAPMVRSILDGTKTQTRRVACKGMIPPQYITATEYEPGRWRLFDASPPPSSRNQYTLPPCPHGQPGDRLWVREAWRAPAAYDQVRPSELPKSTNIRYEADGYQRIGTATRAALNEPWGKLRPSMFMPRWASRITLEVTGVRVERLQDISEADAQAEGVKNSLHMPGGRFANENFAHLWWSINGDGAWESNPWVWVVEFKRLEANPC